MLGIFPGLQRVSGYYVQSDQFFNRRVQVIAAGGQIFEIRYSSQAGVMRALLMNTSQPTDLGGFWSTDDGFRHRILANANHLVQGTQFQALA